MKITIVVGLFEDLIASFLRLINMKIWRLWKHSTEYNRSK